MSMPTQTHVEDTACPTGFIVLPALIGALVWLPDLTRWAEVVNSKTSLDLNNFESTTVAVSPARAFRFAESKIAVNDQVMINESRLSFSRKMMMSLCVRLGRAALKIADRGYVLEIGKVVLQGEGQAGEGTR